MLDPTVLERVKQLAKFRTCLFARTLVSRQHQLLHFVCVVAATAAEQGAPLPQHNVQWLQPLQDGPCAWEGYHTDSLNTVGQQNQIGRIRLGQIMIAYVPDSFPCY